MNTHHTSALRIDKSAHSAQALERYWAAPKAMQDAMFQIQENYGDGTGWHNHPEDPMSYPDAMLFIPDCVFMSDECRGRISRDFLRGVSIQSPYQERRAYRAALVPRV
jgi:hypothetical protein